MNTDGVFNFLRVGMGVLSDPLLSPIIDEVVATTTTKKIPIPGYSRDDVSVTHNKGKLTVKVDNKYLASYHVPHDIDPSKIEVTAKDGLLTIDFENAMDSETEIEIK